MLLSNSYFVEQRVPLYLIGHEKNYKMFIERIIEEIKYKGAMAVFEEIYKADHPIVVETHLERWDDPVSCQIVFRLHYALLAVKTMNITMPVYQPLTFENHLGKIEWKCPACGIINPIEATICGEKHEHVAGCGTPREKTRQEMYG